VNFGYPWLKSLASAVVATGSNRFCGTRADTESADEALYSTASGWTITFEYHLRTLEIRCLTFLKSSSRLGSEGRSIARQRCKPGSRCVGLDGGTINGQQYWLYVAANPETNKFLIFGCLQPQKQH